MNKLILSFFLVAYAISNAQNFKSSTMITPDISIETAINKTDNVVDITFTGPEGRYYAIGLDAVQMSDNPYVFITQDNAIQERVLGEGSKGILLTPPSTTLTSDEVVAGKRIIKFSRPLTGPTAEYFDFSTIDDGSTVNIIWAVGSTFELVYHGNLLRGSSAITFSADETLSIEDITTRSDASNVVLFPVPVKDVLNITEVSKIDNIEIYNINYQKVKTVSKTDVSESINVSDLAPSTYFVKVIGNDGFNTTTTVVKE